MDDAIKFLLRNRSAHSVCAVCGKEIMLKADPYKDYAWIMHPVIGAVLVHRHHLK